MSDRLSGAYWKLWHDTRWRFFVSLFLILMTMFGILAPMQKFRPKACLPSTKPNSWAGELAFWQKANANPTFQYVRPNGSLSTGHRETRSVEQLNDASFLAAHACATMEHPNNRYAAAVDEFNAQITRTTWISSMPYLLLFIGILLSVGPPFSGESMEAFSLTFSLPWSREKWLISKITMSVVLLCILTAFVYVVASVAMHFPYMSRMHGGYASIVRHMRYAVEKPPTQLPLALQGLLAGLVGVSLGTVASMFARNVLTAAVGAGVAAFILVTIHVNGFGESDLLPIVNGAGAITAMLVITISALIVSFRLRHQDF